MREIIFRGKRLNNGEWIEGSLCTTIPSDENFYTISYFDFEGYYIEEKVIPSTIGQYTGLTDKNGTKIFEGDIVKADGYIFTVKFGKCGGVENNDNFGYMGFYFEGFDRITKKCMDLGLRNDICYLVNREVVGNIHDNPELLKRNKSDA